METTWIFRRPKLHRKKYVGTTSIFRPLKLLRKKYVETTWIFRSSKLHLKKYVEMAWKFVEIWSSKYRRNIDVELTLIRRGVPVGKPYICFDIYFLTKLTNFLPYNITIISRKVMKYDRHLVCPSEISITAFASRTFLFVCHMTMIFYSIIFFIMQFITYTA